MNYSAWDPPLLGSIAHLNHVFLDAYWLNKGVFLFPRLDCVSGEATGATRIFGIGGDAPTHYAYFEANVVGTPAYDLAVLYLLVPMNLYFGQPTRTAIRGWAAKWGWQVF